MIFIVHRLITYTYGSLNGSYFYEANNILFILDLVFS
jgi:hypothetical protein